MKMHLHTSQRSEYTNKEGVEVWGVAVPPGEGESHHQLENQDHQGQIKVDIHTADLLRKTGKSAQVGEEGEGVGVVWHPQT